MRSDLGFLEPCGLRSPLVVLCLCDSMSFWFSFGSDPGVWPEATFSLL